MWLSKRKGRRSELEVKLIEALKGVHEHQGHVPYVTMATGDKEFLNNELLHFHGV